MSTSNRKIDDLTIIGWLIWFVMGGCVLGIGALAVLAVSVLAGGEP